MAKHKKTVEQRFWSKVIKTDTCWFWVGATGNFGHGKFYLPSTKKQVKAHRYSYELYNSPIPEGLVVRHTCNNPSCVNPSHLILGTQKQNIEDKKYNKSKQKSIKLTKEEKIERRFWSYVDKDGPTMEGMKTNCWEWIGGYRGKDGYGGYWNGHTNVIATRYIYELVNGPITKGNFICHKCDNPKCVRTDHLFEGTPGDNSRDRTQKGHQKGKPNPGSRHHNSKLTEQDVIEIRRRHGIKLNKDLAKEYNVSQSVISEIVRRRAWKHI